MEPTGTCTHPNQVVFMKFRLDLLHFASFVKADNRPYFYVWTNKDHLKKSQLI